MYEDLNEFERLLRSFGHRVGIIAGLEISGKMSRKDAFLEIKQLYKQLKKEFKGQKDGE